MKTTLIKNARIVNEGTVSESDLLIRSGRIDKISSSISSPNAHTIDAEGLFLFPGVIDDQVHFREPGLTHKADIHTESRAAAAGGITSFMDMPNTIPQTLDQEKLEEKYRIGAHTSLVNYSFFMGVSNDNFKEIMKTDPEKVCGLKIFMGSSTGNMLVDNQGTLNQVFSESPMLIAVHCEDEPMIREHLAAYRKQYGDDIPMEYHPKIRNDEACYLSSSRAVALAKKHGTRLHILHISTAKELELFASAVPLKEKKITAEVCIHHLWFSEEDYARLGKWIKWNPAIKSVSDRSALRKALLNDTLDIVATDHAPHTREEKRQVYTQAPSGGPLVQHALPAMLELVRDGIFPIELIAKKMAHDVADCFRIRERGYLREGFHADLVLVDMNKPWTVSRENILAKCGWSPFEGQEFHSSVTHTFVNGNLVYENGMIHETGHGERIKFQSPA